MCQWSNNRIDIVGQFAGETEYQYKYWDGSQVSGFRTEETLRILTSSVPSGGRPTIPGIQKAATSLVSPLSHRVVTRTSTSLALLRMAP